jgi:PilZ domain
MRLAGKGSGRKNLPLPRKGEEVTVCLEDRVRIPARVLKREGDGLELALTVPTRPFTAEQLRALWIEYTAPRGRVRLHGEFDAQDPADTELLRLRSASSVEVIQRREHVRIRAARPVLVYWSTQGTRIESFTADVSGSGFLLSGPDTVPIGAELKFYLSLAPGEAPVTGVARVVRVDARGRRGVEFIEMSELDRRRLVRFVFGWQREERRRAAEESNGRG